MSTMEEAGHVTKSVDTTSLDVFLWDLILSKLVRVRVVSVSYLRRVSLGYDADTTRIRTGATQIRHGLPKKANILEQSKAP